MKTATVLIVAIISQAIGNVYLTKAMKAVTTAGAGDDLMSTALRRPWAAIC